MNNKDIWVFAEQENGVISDTVYELLSESQKLKELFGGVVTAVLLGSNVSALASSLAAYGADKVIIAENECLDIFKPRTYSKALTAVAQKYQPSILLLGATPVGRDIAPRVMCALRTGLTADAIDLGINDDGDFVQTTPGFGGNILAHICIPKSRPQMVTVRPKVFSPVEPDYSAKAVVIREDVEIQDDDCYKILETEKAEFHGQPLSTAKIVVSCGRGIKCREDMKLASALAEKLGGVVACSRPLVEAEWMPHSSQIGQSGTTIKADYIINIGVSGAMQYVSGMKTSKCIISINSNAEAGIFSVSHYGMVADYRKLLPAILRKLDS